MTKFTSCESDQHCPGHLAYWIKTQWLPHQEPMKKSIKFLFSVWLCASLKAATLSAKAGVVVQEVTETHSTQTKLCASAATADATIDTTASALPLLLHSVISMLGILI